MGPDFDDVDWRTLDPRQYDPRRIIREALLDDAPVPTVRAASVAAAVTLDQCVQATEPLGGAVQRGGPAAVRQRGHVTGVTPAAAAASDLPVRVAPQRGSRQAL